MIIIYSKKIFFEKPAGERQSLFSALNLRKGGKDDEEKTIQTIRRIAIRTTNNLNKFKEYLEKRGYTNKNTERLINDAIDYLKQKLEINERNKNQFTRDKLKNEKKEIFDHKNQIQKDIKNYIAQRIEETLNLGSTDLMKLEKNLKHLEIDSQLKENLTRSINGELEKIKLYKQEIEGFNKDENREINELINYQNQTEKNLDRIQNFIRNTRLDLMNQLLPQNTHKAQQASEAQTHRAPPHSPPRTELIKKEKNLANRNLEILQGIINDIKEYTLETVSKDKEMTQWVKSWISSLNQYAQDTGEYIDNTNDLNSLRETNKILLEQIKNVKNQIEEIEQPYRQKRSQNVEIKQPSRNQSQNTQNINNNNNFLAQIQNFNRQNLKPQKDEKSKQVNQQTKNKENPGPFNNPNVNNMIDFVRNKNYESSRPSSSLSNSEWDDNSRSTTPTKLN